MSNVHEKFVRSTIPWTNFYLYGGSVSDSLFCVDSMNIDSMNSSAVFEDKIEESCSESVLFWLLSLIFSRCCCCCCSQEHYSNYFTMEPTKPYLATSYYIGQWKRSHFHFGISSMHNGFADVCTIGEMNRPF